MDPRQCLTDALAAFAQRDWDALEERLADYRTWRAKGGFEPTVWVDNPQPLPLFIPASWPGDYVDSILATELTEHLAFARYDRAGAFDGSDS